MTKSLREVETVIRALLATGPRDGRDVVAAMGERGFSPKQTRTAREKQNVIIERAGSGADMRSTWRLPDLAEPDIERHRADLKKPENRAPDEATAQAIGAFVPKSAASDPASHQSTTEGVKYAQAREAIDADVRACRERGIPVIVRQVRIGRVRAAVRTDTLSAARSGSQPAIQLKATVLAKSVPATTVRNDPLERSREIRSMEHAELRLYAKQIGIRQRDIDELTIDRLRQNCMLTVASLIEAYTE